MTKQDIAKQIDLKKEAKKKIIELANYLVTIDTKENETGVLDGISGQVLFLVYAGNYFEQDKYLRKAEDLVEKTMDLINGGQIYDTFCSGLAGYGWALQFLEEKELFDAECDDLLPDIEGYLEERMRTHMQNGYFDYMHGYMGIALYFLKRFQNTASEGLKQRYMELLGEVVEKIENQSIKNADGTIAWRSILNYQDKTKGFNLGMAHGMPAIIRFLQKCKENNVCVEKTEKLIKGGLAFLLKQKVTGQPYLFPSWINEKKEINWSRMAWCYGDIGIAYAFWHSDNPLHKKEAVNIMLKASRRKDLEKNLVLDAGICHGAVGIAYQFMKMNKLNPAKEFLEIANYYYSVTLEMASHDTGIGGYKAWGGDKKEWEDKTNLLEGISGIGMCLLNYIDPELDSPWDECFLLS